MDRCSLRQRGLALREWILGWDRDRSTAVGIEQWRERLAAQGFDARDRGVVERRHLWLARSMAAITRASTGWERRRRSGTESSQTLWREMDSNFRFRAKGATDLSFRFFVYVPETVRVLTQRSTLLGNRRFEIPVPPGKWANFRSLENVLASAKRPDGASRNRKPAVSPVRT